MVRVKRKIKDRPILGPSFIKKLLREDYDYGTGNVNGTDIFDITKTGMTFYNQLLPSADDETREYMENRKGIVGHIEYMTPQEYYDDAARIHRTTAYSLKQQREYDRDIIDKLKDVITNKKKKFPITFLSFSKNYRGQEGLHRMYAAAELFGWNDVKFPVLVIEDASWTVSEKISNINVKEKNFKRSEKSLELNEVYPNKGESKKDFISRFMSVTKDEYPDRKQRYAVALSYWNRRNENLIEEKIAYLPKEHIDAINNKYKDYYKNYSIEKVAISDLLKDDPGLNDYNDLGSYHEIIWGDDVSKYRYDPKKNTNPSDVPSVVYKNGKYHINDGRHRIKALANSGYDYVELPVLKEDVLKEAKEDIEKFVDKFGQETYDWFVKSKDRLKNNKISTDILYHVKSTSAEDMQNILHNLQSKVKSDDLTKIQGEYNYLGERDGYKVYKPLDALASMNLGVGSGWCTTGRYGHYGDVNFKPSLKDAKKHWDSYTKHGIQFYYLLDSKTMLAKYAIALYPRLLRGVDRILSDYFIEQTNFEIYNAEDKIDYSAYFKLENVLKLIPESLIFKAIKLEDIGETIEALVQNNTVINSKIYSYSSVNTVIIPEGVTSIGNSAFYNCGNLTHITIPDSVTSIGSFAFYGCTSLTSIEIPNSVTSIGDWAFADCSSLTSIEIPDSLTSIRSSAFSNCSSLTSIIIPDSVVRIDSFAFCGCSSLTSIIIPDTVAHIRYYVFDRCPNLTIYCEAESKPKGWDLTWNRDNRPVVWGYKGKKRESLEEDVEIHNTLNSKFWEDNELKAEVREKIEAIVERFKTYLNDKNIEINVKDILLLGSNASYNYTDDSDLDIHIIVEPKEITEDEELLKQLYDLAASAFNNKFNITLKNSEAEVYVELNDTDAHSNGIYSLEKGWIKEPTKDELKNVELDKKELNKWKKRYLSALKEKDAKKIKKFIAELYKLRKDSIAADGEYSQGNLIFKEMRNLSYISKLKDLLDEIESEELSLEKLNEAKEDIQKFVDKFGQDIYDWFVKSKDRLKNNKISTDILYHVKNTSIEDMQNILHNLQSKVKSNDLTKIQGEYNYLGEFGSYKVYQPLDALASMNLGVGSGWCTTGRYGHYRDLNFKPSLKDAKKHWDEYASRGIEFYYLLDAKTMLAEYAIAVYPKILNVDEVTPDYYIEQTNFEIYNAWDDLDYDAYFSLKDTLEQIPSLNLLFKGEKLEETETMEAIVEENRVIRSPKYIKAKNIIIPDGAISIDDYAFSYSHLTSIEIPNSVKSIGISAFFNCSNLTSIELPDSLTVIGSSAFSNCSSLTSIEIPDSVVRIDSLAFYGCTSLTSIIIPDTVAHIRYYAFDRCINLKIYCEAKSQPETWDKDWNRDNRPVVWGYKGK